MRLPNGYGSVTKLSGKRRRPFVARISVLKSNGVNYQKPIGYFETSAAAMDALAEYRRNPTPFSDKKDITLDVLHQEWKKRKYRGLSPSTIDNYEASWKRFEHLEVYKVANIRTAQLQAIIDWDEENGLSVSSMQKDKFLAVALWDYALENDIVEKNYAKFIILPKKQKAEKECFNDLELKYIEEAAANGIPYADTLLILCYTGFRINEFLALTPFNATVKNGAVISLCGGIKTEAGKNRIIPIHRKIASYINAWLAKGGDYIFCNESGGHISDKTYREKYYYPVFEMINKQKGGNVIRKLPPHACRHTFASILHAADVTPVDIQRLMGHSKYAVTANIYTHVDMDRLTKSVEKLG